MAFRTLIFSLHIVYSLTFNILEGIFDILTEQLEKGYFVKRCRGMLEKLTKNVWGLTAWPSKYLPTRPRWPPKQSLQPFCFNTAANNFFNSSPFNLQG